MGEGCLVILSSKRVSLKFEQNGVLKLVCVFPETLPLRNNAMSEYAWLYWKYEGMKKVTP